MTLKASDLLQAEYAGLESRYQKYQIELEKILTEIRTVLEYCHEKCTTTKVPISIPETSNYNFIECMEFLKAALRKKEFYVKRKTDENTLYISWSAADVSKTKKWNEQQRKLKEKLGIEVAESKMNEKKTKTDEYYYNPDSGLSNMKLRSQIMRKNLRYAHLKNVRKCSCCYFILNLTIK
ncbi:hypothetical protein BDK51DRAFT_26860 [Blyttiomyces helicus]|uniref:Uncharacterized protein n=1 Tax=Blyttiomyces helicus TaxID=388810 RepID=A0A4P9WQC1_9FUNG|nr:hypothetical protein BDK51DRAFT_26860 [Blyttiomyces helicus]|eukprot:RKO94575.1 hypothetical protein BDK51DRAFT_26860 [Blyttiomyces helicus]